MATQKLTKAFIDSLPFSSAGQTTFMDSQTLGFGLRVGATSKVFIVVKRLPHKAPQRVTLGRYGALTVETARKLAIETLGKLSSGLDINAEKRAAKGAREAQLESKKLQAKVDEETLGWLLDKYKENQLIKEKVRVSAATLETFRYVYEMFCERRCQTLKYKEKEDAWENDKLITLENWLNRPLRSITSDEVLARFETMAITRPGRLIGRKLVPMSRTHQLTFKLAQCAFDWYIPRNYHDTKKTEMLENPFKILGVFRKWKKGKPRTRHIDYEDVQEFGKWWTELQNYRVVNEVPSDFIEFSLLQGGRSIEMSNLTWDMVNMKRRVVTFSKTKNNLEYVIPLSKRAYEILERRSERNTKACPWVWEYPQSKTGHVPKDMKHHYFALEKTGAKYVSSHDLRRTWASTAHRFPQFKEREINYLLKHKENDVNESYFVRNERTLRDIVQTVEDHFVAQAEKYVSSLNS